MKKSIFRLPLAMQMANYLPEARFKLKTMDRHIVDTGLMQVVGTMVCIDSITR